MLTWMLANDHITNDFGKLVDRISMMLAMGMDRMAIAAKLFEEGHDPINIRLAYAAGEIKANDPPPAPVKDRCGFCRMVDGQHKMSCYAGR